MKFKESIEYLCSIKQKSSQGCVGERVQPGWTLPRGQEHLKGPWLTFLRKEKCLPSPNQGAQSEPFSPLLRFPLQPGRTQLCQWEGRHRQGILPGNSDSRSPLRASLKHKWNEPNSCFHVCNVRGSCGMQAGCARWAWRVLLHTLEHECLAVQGGLRRHKSKSNCEVDGGEGAGCSERREPSLLFSY